MVPGEETNEKGSEVPNDRFMAGHSCIAISKYVAAGHSVARLSPRPNFVLMPCFGIPTNLKTSMTITIFISVLMLPHVAALSWNIPTHMVNGAISYRLLYRDSPATIPKVRAILEKHPWYADRWRDGITKLPDSQRDEMLFMLAARWADDIRTRDASESHLAWHLINWPFKPEGEPESVRP